MVGGLPSLGAAPGVVAPGVAAGGPVAASIALKPVVIIVASSFVVHLSWWWYREMERGQPGSNNGFVTSSR